MHHYYVIFDLHVNAPGSLISDAEQPMADADHAPAYWTSVATTFRDNPAVIFEPCNEPHITTADAATTDPWGCWLSGCESTRVDTGPHTSKAEDWPLAGMQQLVNVIRATGASNVITLSGLNMANDLSGLLAPCPATQIISWPPPSTTTVPPPPATKAAGRPAGTPRSPPWPPGCRCSPTRWANPIAPPATSAST